MTEEIPQSILGSQGLNQFYVMAVEMKVIKW